MFVDITKYGPKYAEMPNLSQNFYVPHKLLQTRSYLNKLHMV